MEDDDPPDYLLPICDGLYGATFPATLFSIVVYWSALYDFNNGPNFSLCMSQIVMPLIGLFSSKLKYRCYPLSKGWNFFAFIIIYLGFTGLFQGMKGQVYCRCNIKKVYGCVDMTPSEIRDRNKNYPELEGFGRDQICHFIYEPLNWERHNLFATFTVAVIMVFVCVPVSIVVAFALGGMMKEMPRRTNFRAPDIWQQAYGSSQYSDYIPDAWYLRLRFAWVAISAYTLFISILRQVVVTQWFTFYSHWVLILQFIYLFFELIACKFGAQQGMESGSKKD